MDKLGASMVVAVVVCLVSLVTTAIFVFVTHSIWGMYLTGYGPGPSYEQWAGIGFIASVLLHGAKSATGSDDKGGWSLLVAMLMPVLIWALAALSHAVLF